MLELFTFECVSTLMTDPVRMSPLLLFAFHAFVLMDLSSQSVSGNELEVSCYQDCFAVFIRLFSSLSLLRGIEGWKKEEIILALSPAC